MRTLYQISPYHTDAEIHLYQKNECDKQRSHLPNLMRSVYRYYSSMGYSPEYSEGESDDNDPRIPSKLSVNPL